MKLKKRLSTLFSMIPEHHDYDHIWDTCCDHGLLGYQILNRWPNSHCHFVEIRESLTHSVQQKLQQYCPQGRWQVHLSPAEQLTLGAGKHLIIIAGVGGELALTIVEQLMLRHPHLALDFLLCPVHHLYEVRAGVRQLPLQLVSECLVEENKRIYELLYLSHQGVEPISPTGKAIWHQGELSQRYLQRLIAHLERRQGQQDSPALAAYRALQT